MENSSRDSWSDFEERGFHEEVSSPRLSISAADAQRRSIDLSGSFASPPNSAGSTATRSSATSRIIKEENYLLAWLKSINMTEYWDAFAHNDITFDMLTFLTKEDLKTLISRVGDRIRIENAINDLFLHPFGASDSLLSNRETPTSARSPSAFNSSEYSAVTIRFFTLEDKALHLEISPNKPILAYVFQSAKLPSDEHFFLSDGFDIYNDDESIRTAIFKREVREFWIQQTDRSNMSKHGASRLRSGSLTTSNSSTPTGPNYLNSVESTNSDSNDEKTLMLNSDQLIRLNRGERPTSLEVTKNISEFFPNSKKELLDAGLRNSTIINNRLSTVGADWRASVRMSRRLSSLPSLDKVDSPQTEGLNTDESSQNRNAKNRNTLTPDAEFLEKLEHEEMSPTEWLKGKLIGSGSFGSVYLAFNVFSGDILAVKQVQMLMDQNERQKKMVDSLEQEIKLLRVLDHKNIVQYRGFKKEGQFLNIFLEYIAGGSLASKLASTGPFKEYTVRHYISQCLSGLEYLHGKGIIHRDIKGANILVNSDNQVKISDFGLSKHEDASKSRFSMQGTAFWMAPEVARARDRTTTKADIWSLGCLIIELVTGQHPFPKLQAFQAIFKIGNGAIPEIPSTCSSSLKDLIKTCLVVDPADRASATELLEHEFFKEEVR